MTEKYKNVKNKWISLMSDPEFSSLQGLFKKILIIHTHSAIQKRSSKESKNSESSEV